MAKEMGITVETLRQRIYAGVNHPPFQCPARGVYWFPKELAVTWARTKLPVTHEREVEHAS